MVPCVSRSACGDRIKAAKQHAIKAVVDINRNRCYAKVDQDECLIEAKTIAERKSRKLEYNLLVFSDIQEP